MKKFLLLLVAIATVSATSMAEEMKMGKKMPTRFQAVSPDKATLLQEGSTKKFCPECGMTLPMFYKTNHAAKVQGKTEQYCSIHCLATAMNKHDIVSDIKVVDNKTLKFVDANKAWYVFGSNKPATMSGTSKYGFAKKAEAEAFAKKFGGEVKTFKDVLASVESTLDKESAMITKKQAMMAKKGEMMYNKLCKPISEEFKSVAEAKAFLMKEKSCGEIKGKKLQVIGLYLKNRTK